MTRRPTLFLFQAFFVLMLLSLKKQSSRLNSWSSRRHEVPKKQAKSPYWSAQSLIVRNATTMFVVPEEEYYAPSSISSCPVNISFFVYDNMPANLTLAHEAALLDIITNQSERIPENMATEWALLKLFRTSPCRTWDPHQSNVMYVVPYMHLTHCWLAPGYMYQCGQVSAAEISRVFDSLIHYNKSTGDRHVFINIYDTAMSKKRIGRTLLKLTSGPVVKRDGDRPKSIVVPLINDDPRFQPSVLMEKRVKDSRIAWWTRPRQYSFVSAHGGRNTRMKKPGQPRGFREYFSQTLQKTFYFNNNKTLGNLPFEVISLAAGDGRKFVDFPSLYQSSVFCPILPGDTSWQRRFFDVIRCGCLPVLLEWPDAGPKATTSGRSWHVPGGFAVENSLPFFPGHNTSYSLAAAAAAVSDEIRIDYDSFVVRVPGDMQNESNLAGLFDTMHHMLLHRPDEIARA